MTDDRRDQAEGRTGETDSGEGGDTGSSQTRESGQNHDIESDRRGARASGGGELSRREGRYREPTAMARAFDPWRGFQSDVERMFENFFGTASTPFSLFSRPFTSGSEGALVVPSVDVKESDNAIEITAELPGIKEEDIELTLRDGVLTLRGEKRVERDDKDNNYHMTERRFGAFQRSFRLPEDVDNKACEANYENGVLHIFLPKREGASDRGQRIEIGRRQ